MGKEGISRFARGGARIDETHDFKVATIVRGVLWAVERTTEMKRRIVDELDVNVGRFIILAVLAIAQGESDGGLHKTMGNIERTSNLLIYSTKSCV